MNSHACGDLYVQVIVETLNPKNLTKKQIELLKALEEEENASVQQQSEGFFSKVKKKIRNLLNDIKGLTVYGFSFNPAIL